jgi:outer membrane protein assembly factor BamB
MHRAAAVLALAVQLPTPAPAADWSRWLGPNQDGRASGLGVAAGQPVGFEVAWKLPLGKGYTGIAVAGKRAVTMFADGEHDWVVALDTRSGRELWKYKIDAMYPKSGGSEGGPNSMPVIADGTVYALGSAGHLLALGLDDGKEIWKLRIDEELGGRAPGFGFSTVPLVAGDLLFVQTGAEGGKSLVGLDRRTGKVRWSTGDDKAGYASPILATLAGVEQIVALTDLALWGLDPSSGSVLWKREHGLNEGGDAAATPVLIGGDRLFVQGEDASKAFAVKKEGGKWVAEQAWDTRAMKGSLATPVFHEDHLYGFDGDFMTCISAADGTKVWKSRPPGGRGLILVDGHLLVLANDGDLVAVEATSEAYRETGRLKATEAGTWTYPSFGDGVILVRNTREIAALTARPAAPPAPVALAAPAPEHAFARFLARVEAADDKRLLVDDFMVSQRGFPVVEDGWVHFVYRGDVEDVAISGSMMEWEAEEPLARLAGTDLFHRSYPAAPATRWEYRFNVDFENPQPDPLNPRRIHTPQGDRSEVTTAGWQRSAWLTPYAGQTRGSVESFTLPSENLGNERTVEVYLPAGYVAGSTRYPLVLALDGGSWRNFGQLRNVLDHLMGSKAAPVIVAFVHQPAEARGELGGGRIDDYVKMLA